MAGRWTWSSEQYISEFKDLQASAMAVDCLGNWCLLAGRKNLAFVNLKRTAPAIKVTRQSKWDIGCVQWNMHASCAYRFVTACNQRLDVFDFRDASASHLCSLKAHSRTVSDIDWSPFDVNVVASCSVDTFTYFWDVRDAKKPVKSFQTVTGAYQVKWNKITNNLFATTHDGDIRIWDPRKGNTPIQYIAAHPSKIHGLDWSNTDQNKLVTASQDCTIRLWDSTSPQRSEALINSGNPVWRARYTPFGEGVLSVVVPQLRRGENSLYLWYPRDQQMPVHTFMGHKDVILEFQWCKQPEGVHDHHLLTWSKDQSLRIWKVDPVLQKSCGHNIDPASLVVPGVDELIDGLKPRTSAKEGLSHTSVSWTTDGGVPAKGHLHTDHTGLGEGASARREEGRDKEESGEGGLQFTNLFGSSPMLHNVTAGGVLGFTGASSGAAVGFSPSDGWTMASGVGTGVGGANGASSLLPGVLSLEQELTEIQKVRVPGMKLDQVDFAKHMCVFKLFKGLANLEVQLSFPDKYPVKVAPKLTLLNSNLEADVEARVVKAYNDACSLFIKQHLNCVEAALRQMLQVIERSSTSSLDQATEDRKLALEKKFSVEKVQIRSPTSSAQAAPPTGVMFPTGSFQDSHVPFPRTCGARFCSNDNLVTFGVPVSMKKVHEDSEVTPRSLSDMMSYVVNQSPWLRNQPNSFGLGLFYGSSPHNNTEGVSISSFYIEKTNKPRQRYYKTHSHHHHSRQRDSLDITSGKRVGSSRGITSAGGDRKHLKVGVIRIYDITCINPISRELAERYKLDVNNIQAMCEHNASVAKSIDRADLAQVWQLVAHMSHPSVRPSLNSDCGRPFAHTPCGRPLLKKMLDHYGLQRDVQTMAMLCCVFWDGDRSGQGQLDRDAGCAAGGGGEVLTRNHSRTSLEYNAAMAANQGEVTMATSSDSGYYILPVMKSKRSSSWSESFDDFKVMDDKDPREREAERKRILHLNNSKMLDPQRWQQFEQIKHTYANMLFQWGLLNQRRQVLKQTVPTRADMESIELNVMCCRCGEEERGVQCTRCTYPALQCSICHIGVRGAANMCIACGHGGHLSHMAEWFKLYDVCPSGCGCHCLTENTV